MLSIALPACCIHAGAAPDTNQKRSMMLMLLPPPSLMLLLVLVWPLLVQVLPLPLVSVITLNVRRLLVSCSTVINPATVEFRHLGSRVLSDG